MKPMPILGLWVLDRILVRFSGFHIIRFRDIKIVWIFKNFDSNLFWDFSCLVRGFSQVFLGFSGFKKKLNFFGFWIFGIKNVKTIKFWLGFGLDFWDQVQI